MRVRTVGLLLGLGILAIAGGWYFGTATKPAEQMAVSGGQLMFPDLAPKLKDAARVEITHQGKQTVIEKRADGGWGLASMHDYPVQESQAARRADRADRAAPDGASDDRSGSVRPAGR